MTAEQKDSLIQPVLSLAHGAFHLLGFFWLWLPPAFAFWLIRLGSPRPQPFVAFLALSVIITLIYLLGVQIKVNRAHTKAMLKLAEAHGIAPVDALMRP